MFNSQVISHAHSPFSNSRRPILVAWAALAAVVLTALVVAVTVGFGTGSSTQSGSANALPQVRDLPPSAASATQIARASVPAGYVRDPRTHVLLQIQAPSAGQSAGTSYSDSPAALRGLNEKLAGR
jgi:hypothetical protein